MIVLGLVLSLPGKCSSHRLYCCQLTCVNRISKTAHPKDKLRRRYSFAGTAERTLRRLRTTTRRGSSDKRLYFTGTCGHLRKSVRCDQEPTSPSDYASDRHQYVGADNWCQCWVVLPRASAICNHTGLQTWCLVTFYSNTIFQEILGYNGTLSRFISGCLQIWQFLCASSAVFLADRVGRRKLLLVWTGGMAVSQAGLAALAKYTSTSQSAAGATLLFDFMTLAFFPIGLFLISFMDAAEIAPLRIRAKVTSNSRWLSTGIECEDISKPQHWHRDPSTNPA